jgi:hypothetical protein
MSTKLICLVSSVLMLTLAGTNVVFGAAVIERQVNESSDDAEEGVPGGGMDLSSGDLEMPYEDEGMVTPQIIGIRFVDIAIPRGSTIPLAWMQFDVDETKGGELPVSLIIEGELSPDAVTFSSTANISSRPRTTANAVWVPSRWTETHTKDYSPDLSYIIEEIVNQPAWKSGNALVLIISDDPANPSQGLRCAESWDGAGSDTDQIPFLHIEFTNWSAMDPIPADGALYEDSWATLSWTPGQTAVSHNIYFGENFDDVNAGGEGAFQGNQTETHFIVGSPGSPYPDGLVAGATYYWRVDEVDADGTTIYEGEVWSFSVPTKTAYNPNPPDGTEFAPIDVTISWTAGFGTKLHHVYFGDNFDDVNAGTPDTYKGTAADPNYTTGPLAGKTAYYWRVDEFDGSTTYKGDIWSFTTVLDIPITDPNLLCWWKFDDGAGTTAVDSSGHDHYGTVNGATWVADGRIGGALEFGGDGDHVLDADGGDYLNGLDAITVCVWIKSDVTSTEKGFVCFIEPAGGDNGGMRYDAASYKWPGGTNLIKLSMETTSGNMQLEASDNTQTTQWQHVALVWSSNDDLQLYINGQLNKPRGTQSRGGTIEATKLIVGKSVKDVGADDGWDGLVDDVRVYNKVLTADEIKQVMRGDLTLAWNPSPRKGAVNVKQTQILKWSAGDHAVSHLVYFGTDEEAVKNADTGSPEYKGVRALDAESYDPGKLLWDTTYYWRIDEVNDVNPDSPWTGSLWSFTTANFLIVDDFEEYDVGNNEIWWAWKDGLGYGVPGADPYYAGNGSGSAVGDENTPSYTEETIVHGGNQAMPLFYDNNKQGFFKYSEAELTLTYPRDWTENGVSTLTIWFRGDSANAAEPLYVALNGSVVVTNDNPDAAQATTWTEWNIDLQAFADQGVNLANVNTIALGLGNKKNPLAGGSGTMYFDDIRLYPPAP